MAIKRPLYIRAMKSLLGKELSYMLHNRLLSLYNIDFLYKCRLNFLNLSRKDVFIGNEEQRIVEQLRLNGICKSDIEKLNLKNVSESSIIEDWFKISATNYFQSDNAKSYEVKYSNMPNNINLSSLLINLSNKFKPIADSYLGCNSKLQHYDLWHTLERQSDDRIQSQNWHRDPEDRRILKIWVYLDSIGERNGAMEFIETTHGYGNYSKYLPNKFPFGKYVNDHELFELKDLKTQAIGIKYSVFFVDTSGFHRGGYVENGDRKMIHFVFTTPICPYQEVVVLK